MTSGTQGFFARRRRERARTALERMLALQENKARRLAQEGRDLAPHLQDHSREVRDLLEGFYKIGEDARVLEVGSGAHGLIFFFGAPHGIGIDPLADHYVRLFPAWQRRAPTVTARGESLPFPDNSFEVLLSDDVLDYAEDPAAILAEMTRVMTSSGILYLTLNISHPVWKVWDVLRRAADFHTTNISLQGAHRLVRSLGLRVVWESHNIVDNRATFKARTERRLQALVKSLFYYRAQFGMIAVKDKS